MLRRRGLTQQGTLLGNCGWLHNVMSCCTLEGLDA